MEAKYLPIGSVVLLEGGTKKVMITGFLPMQSDSPNEKIYDYSGCLFPEGLLSSDQTAVFDHSQIKEICFIGFKNEESISFNEAIKEAFAEENMNTIVTEGPKPLIEDTPGIFDTTSYSNTNPQQMPAQPIDVLTPTPMPAQPMQQVIQPTPLNNQPASMDLFPFGGEQSTSTNNSNPMFM